MSKYQAYPEYKDSEIEWLDDIPLNWSVCRLKQMLSSPMSYGANEAAERAITSEPRYIRITDMNNDGSLKNDTFRSLPWAVANQYLLKDLDILLARSGATVGKSFIYREDFGNCCYAGYLIKASCDPKKLNPEYAFWFFQSAQYWQYIAGSQIQATIQNVSAEKYGEMYLPLPSSINEQTHIAAFLDHETAKIDTLIEKQQQLIELLKEKRQAVISYAVTKGLNPDAPMKDSGIEWLGEVPAHWSLGRIGYYGRVLNGYTPSKTNNNYWNSKDIPWLSSGSVNQYHIKSASDYISHKALNECSVELLPAGTLVLGMIGQGKTRGTSAVTKIEATINQNLAAIIPDHRLLSDYAHLFLQAAYDELRECARGGNQAALNCEIISDFKITVPPILEQKTLIDKVTSQLHKIDLLQNKLNGMIANSEERRTALISAAVTGKIDVRNWVAPTTSSYTNEAQHE
ncbi:restriction endonuclease subunit S [Photobacterium leiognathi subsp. mandapamensis]